MQNIFQILLYGTFFDFPRGIYVKVGEYVIALECKFDEVADEYNDYYEVCLVADAIPYDLQMGGFRSQNHKIIPLGQLPIQQVTFDASRRKSLKSIKLEALVEKFSHQHKGQ